MRVRGLALGRGGGWKEERVALYRARAELVDLGDDLVRRDVAVRPLLTRAQPRADRDEQRGHERQDGHHQLECELVPSEARLELLDGTLCAQLAGGADARRVVEAFALGDGVQDREDLWNTRGFGWTRGTTHTVSACKQ